MVFSTARYGDRTHDPGFTLFRTEIHKNHALPTELIEHHLRYMTRPKQHILPMHNKYITTFS